ncbi:MAG: selenocysteine-specific translation elongation factor, partial [candidate division Zixibacteria bacterium]|nr:selenocysteine-specific translation elongation factor [candidate division Zixibacteria bacterium]
MFVLGTAGHIDHGKSKLVEALTGIDPDRLPEEKRRGMTIDLGFAWFSLPDGSEVGIVDVPGHERFVKNMVAGVGGIDAVLFVVAADDGWMPQSEEHLQVLDFLKIKKGIVVITKIDMVKEDWLSLVEEDIKEKVKGTILESAPILKVSSPGKIGIDKLYDEIAKMISKIQPRKDIGKPRMYIDRVFTMAGRGTVVTGTLIDGYFHLGEEIQILPQRISARIRELQTHKRKFEKAMPGTRVAMNLAGVEKEKIQRGDVVTKAGQDETTDIFTAKVDVVSTMGFPIKHNAELLLILGTTELLARINILNKDKIEPGGSALVQFKCKKNLLARIGDHFILRLPSPQITIGGGIVLDVSPKIYKKKDKWLVSDLERRLTLNLPDLILSNLERKDLVLRENILKASNFSQNQIESTLMELEKAGKIFLTENLVTNRSRWEELLSEIIKKVEKTHQRFPFKIGLKSAELSSKLKVEEYLLTEAIKYLIKDGRIVQQEAYLRLSSHQPKLSSEQTNLSRKILQKFVAHPLSPPTKEEILDEDSNYEDVLMFLIQ